MDTNKFFSPGVDSRFFIASVDWDCQAQHGVLFETGWLEVIEFLSQAEVGKPRENDGVPSVDLGSNVESGW